MQEVSRKALPGDFLNSILFFSALIWREVVMCYLLLLFSTCMPVLCVLVGLFDGL